jgi:tetratricopeptide (TPR) repeat protein
MSGKQVKLVMVLAGFVIFAAGVVGGMLFSNSRSVDLQNKLAGASPNEKRTESSLALTPAKRRSILDFRIGTASENVDDRYQRGKVWLDEKNWPKAYADFSAAITKCEARLAKNKDNDTMKLAAWSYQDRAYALLMMNRYEEGVKDLDRAIELRPKYRTNYLNRAKAYRKLGKVDLATKDIETARTIPDVVTEDDGFK